MTIYFAMAKNCSDDTSSFVKNNLKTKLEKGEYPGVAPYDYLSIDENGVVSRKKFDRKKQEVLEALGRTLKRIELDPVEAPLLRKLIELVSTPYPCSKKKHSKLASKAEFPGKTFQADHQ